MDLLRQAGLQASKTLFISSEVPELLAKYTGNVINTPEKSSTFMALLENLAPQNLLDLASSYYFIFVRLILDLFLQISPNEQPHVTPKRTSF